MSHRTLIIMWASFVSWAPVRDSEAELLLSDDITQHSCSVMTSPSTASLPLPMPGHQDPGVVWTWNVPCEFMVLDIKYSSVAVLLRNCFLLGCREPRIWSQVFQRLGVVMLPYHSSIQELRSGESGVQGHSLVYGDFKASLDYVISYHK